MARVAEVDFNDPVNGRHCLATVEGLVRIMVENRALRHVDYRHVETNSSYGGYLDMIAKKEEWEDGDRKKVFFHRPYYFYGNDGITIREIIEKYGWTITRKELD